MRLGVLLSLMHVMRLTGMIGDQSAACTGTRTDRGTFGSAEQSADHGTTYGRTADDLGFRMVPGIMVVLLALGLTVRLLAERTHRK